MSMIIAIISAHCDDAEIWMGGTISYFVEKGHKVHILTLVQEESERILEAEEAAKFLNVKYNNFSLSEVENVIDFLLRNKIEVIFTHPENDTHPEHSIVNMTVKSMVLHMRRRSNYPRNLFSYTCYYGMLSNGETYQPQIYVDVSNFWKIKTDAIKLHCSQSTLLLEKEYFSQFELYGRRIGTDYAEVFRELPIFGRISDINQLSKIFS